MIRRSSYKKVSIGEEVVISTGYLLILLRGPFDRHFED